MNKVELTHAKLAELKKKAAGCDPKYWIMDQHGDVVAVDFDNKNTKLKIASVDFLDDAEHIAAADPATVIALVEEIELLRKRVDQKYKFESEAKNEIQDVDGKCNQCGNPLTEMTTNDLSTQLMCLVCRDESEAIQ